MPPPQPRMTDRSEAARGDALRRRGAVSAGLRALGLATLVDSVCLLALLAGEAGPGEDGVQPVVVDRTCHDATPFRSLVHWQLLYYHNLSYIASLFA